MSKPDLITAGYRAAAALLELLRRRRRVIAWGAVSPPYRG